MNEAPDNTMKRRENCLWRGLVLVDWTLAVKEERGTGANFYCTEAGIFSLRVARNALKPLDVAPRVHGLSLRQRPLKTSKANYTGPPCLLNCSLTSRAPSKYGS